MKKVFAFAFVGLLGSAVMGCAHKQKTEEKPAAATTTEPAPAPAPTEAAPANNPPPN